MTELMKAKEFDVCSNALLAVYQLEVFPGSDEKDVPLAHSECL